MLVAYPRTPPLNAPRSDNHLASPPCRAKVNSLCVVLVSNDEALAPVPREITALGACVVAITGAPPGSCLLPQGIRSLPLPDLMALCDVACRRGVEASPVASRRRVGATPAVSTRPSLCNSPRWVLWVLAVRFRPHPPPSNQM